MGPSLFSISISLSAACSSSNAGGQCQVCPDPPEGELGARNCRPAAAVGCPAPVPPVHSALAEEVLIRLLPEGTQYHLSARMCPTHRQRIFQSVRDRLRAGDPLYLASTQVIEAGVDIDFPTAFRAVAHWIPSFRRTAGATGKENRQNRARLCFSPGKWYNANGHLPGGDR